MSTFVADAPASDSAPARSGLAWWALWGVAAGLLGVVATVLTTPTLSEDEYRQGAALIDLLDRKLYHLGVVTGFFAVVCTLFTAAGWRRWAERVAPGSLAAATVWMALAATAGAMMLGYGFKGSMAVYLDGGIDEGSMTAEGLYAVFMFLDFGPWIAWWGGAIAAGVIAWLSLRDRLLPLWMGAVSVLFAAVPIGVLIATGLPGLPAVSTVWLAIISLGALFTRRMNPASEG